MLGSAIASNNGSIRANLHDFGKFVENLTSYNDFELVVYRAFVKHPNTPIDILEQLTKSPYCCVKKTLAHRANSPIHLIAALAIDIRVSQSGWLIQNRRISANSLSQLTTHSNLRVRQFVAQHPNTPDHALQSLIEQSELHSFIAQNINLPQSLFARLLQNKATQIAIAKNPNAPTATLEKLVDFSHCAIALVFNPNTKQSSRVQLLEKLAKEPKLSIRKLVARHPQTPSYILIKWSREYSLRIAIASNPSTPAFLLEKLAHLSYNQILNWQQVRFAVARNPSTPSSVLMWIWKAVEGRYGLDLILAKHPNTPESILEQLAYGYGESTLFAVAQNPSASPVVLEALWHNERGLWSVSKPVLRKLILRHPNAPLAKLRR